MLDQLYVVHDDELAKMAKMYESANQQWLIEKDDLQKQYAKKLNEVQSRHKVSHVLGVHKVCSSIAIIFSGGDNQSVNQIFF